jgi:hypothetical protein
VIFNRGDVGPDGKNLDFFVRAVAAARDRP